MGGDSAHELLAQLVEVCEFIGERATQLAAVDGIDASLRALLLTRSVQYGRAAAEIGPMVHRETTMPAHRRRRLTALAEAAAADDDAVVACWERAECVALMCFRDAFDAGLPPPLAATVKKHFESALAGLDRLRAAPMREAG
jgi:hypothetical protein